MSQDKNTTGTSGLPALFASAIVIVILGGLLMGAVFIMRNRHAELVRSEAPYWAAVSEGRAFAESLAATDPQTARIIVTDTDNISTDLRTLNGAVDGDLSRLHVDIAAAKASQSSTPSPTPRA